MKKIYALALGLFSLTAVAQVNDLAIAIDSYASGSTQTDDPLIMDFTITNNGDNIPAGDTIYFFFTIGSSYYSISPITAGYVSYNLAGVDNGGTLSFNADDITPDWAYGEGGLDPMICVTVSGVGIGSLSSAWDDNLSDNQACVTYDLPYVTGVEDLNASIGAVYVVEDILRVENNLEGYIDNANIMITNVAGQVVQNDFVSLTGGVNDINLNETSTGMYLVTITANGESTTKKVVIK